jgi:hypothetical protein
MKSISYQIEEEDVLPYLRGEPHDKIRKYQYDASHGPESSDAHQNWIPPHYSARNRGC